VKQERLTFRRRTGGVELKILYWREDKRVLVVVVQRADGKHFLDRATPGPCRENVGGKRKGRGDTSHGAREEESGHSKTGGLNRVRIMM
jgi:hypothetical protein